MERTISIEKNIDQMLDLLRSKEVGQEHIKALEELKRSYQLRTKVPHKDPKGSGD